jgi:hypothetical protein
MCPVYEERQYINMVNHAISRSKLLVFVSCQGCGESFDNNINTIRKWSAAIGRKKSVGLEGFPGEVSKLGGGGKHDTVLCAIAGHKY